MRYEIKNVRNIITKAIKNHVIFKVASNFQIFVEVSQFTTGDWFRVRFHYRVSFTKKGV